MDELQQAVNEAVWLLKEGRLAEAMAVLLRHYREENEAADMLEFFFGQMQMHSPGMGGNHSYRFRSGGWPMTHCKGPSAEDAVRSAIREIKRERDQSA